MKQGLAGAGAGAERGAGAGVGAGAGAFSRDGDAPAVLPAVGPSCRSEADGLVLRREGTLHPDCLVCVL